MTMQNSSCLESEAKYRLQIVSSSTRATRQLDYEFFTIHDALEILNMMASGGRNEYQVYDVSTDTVVHSIAGWHQRQLH